MHEGLRNGSFHLFAGATWHFFRNMASAVPRAHAPVVVAVVEVDLLQPTRETARDAVGHEIIVLEPHFPGVVGDSPTRDPRNDGGRQRTNAIDLIAKEIRDSHCRASGDDRAGEGIEAERRSWRARWRGCRRANQPRLGHHAGVMIVRRLKV